MKKVHCGCLSPFFQLTQPERLKHDTCVWETALKRKEEHVIHPFVHIAYEKQDITTKISFMIVGIYQSWKADIWENNI